MRKIVQYLELSADIPGWFEPYAASAWDCLLAYQEGHGISGDAVEIGVWKGKSAAMAALHLQDGERGVFVDYADLTDAHENVVRVAPGSKTHFLRMSSDAFRWDPLFKEAKGRTRWMHIDGGHSEADVLHDLDMAHTLLNARGMVILDDFFSPGYPQITQAVFRYLDKFPKRFALLLVGHNKGYLSRPSAAAEYLQYIRDGLHADMAQHGCDDVSFWKTSKPDELNAFGITGFTGTPYRGLDSDHGAILI